MAQRLLTVRELADQLNCNPMTIYRAHSAGELEGIRLGQNNALRFEQKAVNAYLKARKTTPQRKKKATA